MFKSNITVITWGVLIKVTRHMCSEPDIRTFSDMTGISIERLKKLETNIEEPSKEEIEKIKSTSNQNKKMIEAVSLFGIPCIDPIMLTCINALMWLYNVE